MFAGWNKSAPELVARGLLNMLVKYVYAIENRRQGTCVEAQGRGQGRARCRDYKTMFSSVSGRVGEWE